MAIDHIGTFLDGGNRIRDLWLEYEDGTTAAAAFDKKVDKLIVLYKALEYEQQEASPYSLQIFWDNTRIEIEGTPLFEIWEDLSRQRPRIDPPKPDLVRKPLSDDAYERIKREVLFKIGKLAVLQP